MSFSTFSPKDFFLWLGSMVALYVSVGSLATLLFNCIDIVFPDQLEDPSYYQDPYTAGVRFAIASLVVVFPLFLFLTRTVHEDIRRDSDKASLGVRKWLVYLTIFAAGAFLVGDLIALINTFLNGEITTRFILKVGVVFVIAGSVFWYYMQEIRGRWETDVKLSKQLGYGVIAVVLATVIGGFYLIGTPGDARASRFDAQRVGDLAQLQSQIIEYWQAKQELPESLRDLENSAKFAPLPLDPETNAPYGYKLLSQYDFQLCTRFNREETRLDGAGSTYRYESVMMDADWSHPAGEYCFERTIDPDFYPALGERAGVPKAPPAPPAAASEEKVLPPDAVMETE